MGSWSSQIAVALSLRVVARPLHVRSRSPTRSCLSNSRYLTSRRPTTSSQRAHTPGGLLRRSRSRTRASVPAARLLAAHPRLFVAGLPAAAPRAGGLPSGGLIVAGLLHLFVVGLLVADQVGPGISVSSGEMSAMSGPVEWNAEPGPVRPPPAAPRTRRPPSRRHSTLGALKVVCVVQSMIATNAPTHGWTFAMSLEGLSSAGSPPRPRFLRPRPPPRISSRRPLLPG